MKHRNRAEFAPLVDGARCFTQMRSQGRLGLPAQGRMSLTGVSSYSARGPQIDEHREKHQLICMTLTSRQSRFVEEYLVDLNGKQAAIRCGYSKVTAEAQASRLLRNVQVRVALEDALKARSKRTEVTADRVLNELAKIAFSNMKDYWPQPGERVDLSRLDEDRTAAIKEITIEEKVDRAGVLHRHIHLRLHDKIGALNSLARHLGLFTDRHVIENSIEYRVTRMTSEERLALVAEILEEGDRLLTMLTPEELVEIEPRQLAP